jgi:hypothetical protein
MDDAEIYYQEAINTHKWGKRANRQEAQYAFKAVDSGTETEVEKDKPKEESYEETIKALTAQLQEYATAYTTRWSGSNQKPNLDGKYAWKHIPPKAGEPVIKKMLVEGQSKTYYWCPHHLQWTIHKPSECKRLKPSRGKKSSKEKKVIKRQNFKEKKQAYIQAKAAYQACMNGNSEDELGSSNSDKDEDSNKLISDYSSEGSYVS